MGINPAEEKKLYLFSEGADYEKACLANFKLYTRIKNLNQKEELNLLFLRVNLLFQKKLLKTAIRFGVSFGKFIKSNF